MEDGGKEVGGDMERLILCCVRGFDDGQIETLVL